MSILRRLSSVELAEIPNRARWIAFLFMIGVTITEGIPLMMGFAGNMNRLVSRAPRTPFAWMLAMATAAIFVWLTLRQHPFIAKHLFTFSVIKVVAIPMALVSGIFEEAFFRGFTMNLAFKNGWSALSQILISALIFGMAHGIWGLFGRSLRVAFGAVAVTGLLGASLAIVYLVGERSIAPCALAHVLINLAIEPWLILSAAARQWIPKK